MKAEFISRVMQIMNELGWNDTEADAFIGSDTTKLEGHIESVFVDAWRKAVNILPKSYFNSKDFSSAQITENIHSGTGHIELPEDFYALYLFKMEGWQRPVETLYDYSDPIASIQSNEYVRGNIVRPVCLKNVRYSAQGDVSSVLEYYSLPKGISHKIEVALYISLIEPLSDSTIIKEKLFAPLAYLCASLVFYIFEKNDIAKVLETKALEIIN